MVIKTSEVAVMTSHHLPPPASGNIFATEIRSIMTQIISAEASAAANETRDNASFHRCPLLPAK